MQSASEREEERTGAAQRGRTLNTGRMTRRRGFTVRRCARACGVRLAGVHTRGALSSYNRQSGGGVRAVTVATARDGERGSATRHVDLIRVVRIYRETLVIAVESFERFSLISVSLASSPCCWTLRDEKRREKTKSQHLTSNHSTPHRCTACCCCTCCWARCRGVHALFVS